MNQLNISSPNLKFEAEGHRHLMLINGLWTQVPGCTSVSGLFQDDGWKFAWPVKLMEERLLVWWKDLAIPCTNNKFKEAVRGAKNAWREKRDSSASKGTAAHKIIEDYICGQPIPETHEMQDEVRHCFLEFIRWEAEAKPEWLGTEIQVGSEKHRFAGILDQLARINGRLTLLDVKTSRDIKDDYAIQLAGLHLALEEMGTIVDDRAILHLPKEGKHEFRIIGSDLEADKRAFLAGLEFYRHRSIFFARNKLKEAA